MKSLTIFLLLSVFVVGCSSDDVVITTPTTSIYFPPTTPNVWEAVTPQSLGWNEAAIQPLKDYLLQKHTRSFMILVNGNIVLEEYFDGHTQDSTWQWNSAGKTLVATTIWYCRTKFFIEY